MRKVKNKIQILLVSAIVVASMVLSVIPAGAALRTYVTNNRGSTVPMYYAPTSAYNNVKARIPNGTKFQMKCWINHQWYTGNYRTNRWFYGLDYNSGSFGYINASYVINQTTVPHC